MDTKKLFYRIVHKFTASTNNEITLNPSSFPFNGLCRIVVESVNFNTVVDAAATTSSVLITMDITQPYSQDNLNQASNTPAYNPSNIIAIVPHTTPLENDYLNTPDNNEVLVHLNPSQKITLKAFRDDKSTSITYTSCIIALRIYKVDN